MRSMRSLAAIVSVLLVSAAASADPLSIPAPLDQLGIEKAQGEHQLLSVKQLATQKVGDVEVVLWEERSRFEQGPRKQETVMLGMGSVADKRIYARVLLEAHSRLQPGKSFDVTYAWTLKDLDGDGVAELKLQRRSVTANNYDKVALPGQGELPSAPRTRLWQVRFGALHEVPQAISRCPRTGPAAAPLSRPPTDALGEEVLTQLDAQVGESLQKTNAAEVRCALWDRYLARGEPPFAWANTITSGIPAVDTPMWLEPAGRLAAAWFRTTDESLARLSWDGQHLEVTEPAFPELWPNEGLDTARPPNVVRAFKPLQLGPHLDIYLELEAGADRRAVVLDAVSLKALVNEPLGRGSPSLHEGARPQLRVGKKTWTYEPATGNWR